MPRQRSVVIATASEDTIGALQAIFAAGSGWECHIARDGAQALAHVKARERTLALLLIEASFLRGDGLAAARYLQRHQTVDDTPVMLLLPQAMQPAEALPEGLYYSEFITTPIRPQIAGRRIASVLALHGYRARDITLLHAISRDPLTGLLTGKSLEAGVAEALAQSAGSPGLMLHINIDNTKAINARSGYPFGDLVLVNFARALADALPGDAIIGRVQGDSFCAFLPFRPDEMQNIRMLERLKADLRRPYPDAPGGPQLVTCCIGAAASPQYGTDFVALYDAAETAGNAAKLVGRDVLLIYTQALAQRLAPQGAELFREGIESVMLADRLVAVRRGRSTDVAGYDYVPMPSDMKANAFAQAQDRLERLPDKSIAQAMRVDLRRFFGFVQGVPDVPFQFYAVLGDGRPEMLPQLLREALAEWRVDPARITVSISQSSVLGMSRSCMEQLARDVRQMGLRFGVYGVGEPCIACMCFAEGLFDWLMFTPQFAYDMIDGFYPQAFIEQVIGYLAQCGATICLPVQLSEGNRKALAGSLGADFCYYAESVEDMDALARHARGHRHAQPQPAEKKELLTFRIGEDRYNEIFSRSGIVLLDWRAHNNTLAISQSFDAVHGYPPPEQSLSALLEVIIHPEDRARMLDILLQVKHGRPNAEGVFRVLRQIDGERVYGWRRSFFASTLHENGVVAHVYVISFDVDRERRAMQDIMKIAETDPLTQLLNRGATEGRIRGCLEGDGAGDEHALMLVDLDDFKGVNDRLGHMEGDEALKYIARQMQALFRTGDIIGRIGGDEFMVFLKGMRSKSLVAKRAAALCRMAREGTPEWRLGCTIGIALYPRDGGHFEDLYAKADLALYKAKALGKGQYVFYDTGMEG